MSIFSNSTIVKTVDKFDINDSVFEKILKESFLFSSLQKLLNEIREKTKIFVSSSQFFKNIDYFILALITALIFCSTFASTSVLGLIAIIAFALAALKFVFVQEDKSFVSSFHIPIFFYFGIAALSVAFSYLLLPSIKGYAKMLVYACSYITFFTVLKSNPKRILYILSVLAFATGFESIVAIFQKFAGVEALATWQDKTNTNPEQLMNRVYGTLQPYNPNLLAGFLIPGLASTIGAGAIWLNKKEWLRGILFLLFSVLTVFAIVLTGSRGSYIGLVGMISVFAMISGHLIWHDYKSKVWLKKLWIWIIIVGVLGVIALIIISPSIQHRIASIFTLRGDSSNSFRMNVYISSFKMFLDNWLIGIGPGNTTFRLMYGLYMTTGFDALGTYSVPLEIAVESGIFALLSFAWLVFMSFVRSVKNICMGISFENKILVATCIIAITGMMLHGIVDTIWYRPQIQFLFWLYVAVLAIITSKGYGQNND